MEQWNGSTLFKVLREAGEKYGGREALIVGSRDQMASYKELSQKSDWFARALASIGACRGDRVAIWMTNSVEWAISFFAIQQIGAIAVPINTRFRAREVSYILRKVEAKFLIMHDKFLGKVDALAIVSEVMDELKEQATSRHTGEGLPDIIVFSTDRSTSHPFRSLEAMMHLGETLAKVESEVDVSDAAVVMFTSGTTSFPKGAVLSHKGLSLLAQHVGARQRLTVEDRFYSISPFFHCAGLMHALLTCLTYGVTLYTTVRYQVDEAYEVFSKERCTVYHGFIIPLEEMSKSPQFKAEDFRYLTRAWYSAPAERMAKLESVFGTKMCEVYGLTETGGNVSICHIDEPEQIRHDTDGRPHSGIEVKIIEPDTGKVVEDETPGELCVRGWNVMKGYYGDVAATRHAIDSDGWMHTGDRGVKYKSGYIKFLSRIKDIIRVGGENLSPSEVEEFLMDHPAVREAAVIGVPDSRLDEVPVAFVQKVPGASVHPEELIKFAASRLAKFKVPKYVFLVEEFPRTEATLRIQKNVLHEWAIQRISGSDSKSNESV